MSTFPTSPRAAFLTWCQGHAPVFTANAAQIGLTPAHAAAFATAVTTAENTILAQETAKQAYRAATEDTNEAFSELRRSAGHTVGLIRAFAEASTKPANVYSLAQIPPPATPGPTPPPGTPFDFTVGLLQNGALELRWKCNNPSGTQGTIYEVKRKVGSGALTYIGPTGTKNFLDQTLPATSLPVTYQITAVRSTARGNPAQFTVSFGIGGDGITVASVSETPVVKMAA